MDKLPERDSETFNKLAELIKEREKLITVQAQEQAKRAELRQLQIQETEQKEQQRLEREEMLEMVRKGDKAGFEAMRNSKAENNILPPAPAPEPSYRDLVNEMRVKNKEMMRVNHEIEGLLN